MGDWLKYDLSQKWNIMQKYGLCKKWIMQKCNKISCSMLFCIYACDMTSKQGTKNIWSVTCIYSFSSSACAHQKLVGGATPHPYDGLQSEAD